jgi:hypothetical protein
MLTHYFRYSSAIALIYLFLGTVTSPSVSALEALQIPASGEIYEVSLNSADLQGAPIEVYFISSGSVSSAVGLLVEGPPGLLVVVDSIYLPPGVASYQDALRYGVASEPATLRGVAELDASDTDRFLIDPSGTGGRVELLYHLHKDACLSDRTARYISRISFRPDQVPAENLSNGFTIRVGVKEFPYSGSQVASIKPVAEGRYRGEPILLMAAIQYGAEYVNIIKRNGIRVRSRKKLPVVKSVYYRGYALSLARLSGVLNGGKATFEISNGRYIYGVCFSLNRRRQRVNGYP